MDRLADFVKSLSDSGIESPYLDRLRKKLAPRVREGGMQALQREIIGEMAAALGRAETLLDEALLRCELAGRHLDALEARKQRGEDVELELSRAFDEFEQTRTAAHRRRWELVVHREALGIRRHEPVLSELYPIPAERRPPG